MRQIYGKLGNHFSLFNNKSSQWQIKLVKCMVQDIVVHISVSQIDGLCTLIFLKKVIFHSCLVLFVVFP